MFVTKHLPEQPIGRSNHVIPLSVSIAVNLSDTFRVQVLEMTKLLRPSDLYPVVYGFLSKCGHKSAMKAFLKDTELNKSQLKTEEDLLEMIASYKVRISKLNFSSVSHIVC